MNYNKRTVELVEDLTVSYIFDRKDYKVYDSKVDLASVYGADVVEWLLSCNKFNVIVDKGIYYIEDGLWAMTKLQAYVLKSEFAVTVDGMLFSGFSDKYNVISMACLLEPILVTINELDVYTEGCVDYKDSREFYSMEQLSVIFGANLVNYLARTGKWQVFYGDNKKRYLEDGFNACVMLKDYINR